MELINQKVLNKDYKDTKQFLNDVKNLIPTVYITINDYFQAKTCKEDFTDSVSVEEIREFATSHQFGILIGLKYDENEPVSKASYLALNSAYKLMNCGSEGSFARFIGATSEISIELDSKYKEE